MKTNHVRATRAATAGLMVNLLLVAVKFVAGVVGNSYALIADAVESTLDVFSSLIVWSGLEVAARPPDDDYPYGYGKAESLAASVVAAMLLVAGFGIGVAAIREILTPHHAPAAFTLLVLVLVIVVKETLFRTVLAVGESTHSLSLEADAWHHRSDAITSLAAFVGIALSVYGGEGWAAADDWAALLASFIIGYNGVRLFRRAARDLMDRQPATDLPAKIQEVAASVPGICRLEKLRLRRMGAGHMVDLHAQTDGNLPLRDAHALGGKLRAKIRTELPEVLDVLIHMEPFEDSPDR